MKDSVIQRLFVAGRIMEPVYSTLMRIRARLYERGVFSTYRPGVPVISIGNLLMGGTGKTPHVIAACDFLMRQGLRPAVVTRGYGGKAGKGPLVVSDHNKVCSDAVTAGDEPFMMARQMPGVPVIAGSDRCACAICATEQLGAEVIVLDDGFQHMSLCRDRDVVLVPAKRPFGNGHVFPGGYLREPLDALKRATCIVITGCQQVPAEQVRMLGHRLQAMVHGIPVFHSTYAIKGIRPLRMEAIEGSSQPSPHDLSEIPLLAVCAIGMPESFFETLRGCGLTVCATMSFRDHHSYTTEDVRKIVEQASSSGAKAVITTAKDSVKISTILQDTSMGIANAHGISLPVYVLDIQAEPDQGFYEHISMALG